MKRQLYLLMSTLLAMATLSCASDEIDVETPPASDGQISIDVSSCRLLTRGAVSDNAIEEAVSHLDVVIFAEDGTFQYSERVMVDASAGTIRLNAKRSVDFVEDTRNTSSVLLTLVPASQRVSLRSR